MAIYLYTIESTFRDRYGISAEPGIRLSVMAARPELQSLRQGVPLELRLPDENARQTHLVNYGVGATMQDDGSLLLESDPFVRLTLPLDLLPESVPEGTEIWWAVEKMLAKFSE